MSSQTRSIILGFALFGLLGCTGVAAACPVTQPVLLTPPDDSAVQNAPQPDYYIVNDDRSIWASAWWAGEPEYPLKTGDEGNKIGWFRPAGATLKITGQRLDGQAPPLVADVPCCYPTRFQATGVYFPTEGCWHIVAEAGDRRLAFVVRVEP